MKVNSWCLLLLLCGLIVSCKNEKGLSEYIAWMGEHKSDLEKYTSEGDVEYKSTLIPSQYACLIQNKSLISDQDTLADICKGFDNHMFIKFDIYLNSAGNKQSIFTSCKDDAEFGRLNQYLFQSKEQFKLLADQDTILPAFCQFERTYELSPYNSINLIFDMKDLEKAPKSISLLYEDDWFNNGRYTFTWPANFISSIPTLNFTK